MFKTPSEKETFMVEMKLHYGPEGQLLDDEGGVYNAFCYEYEYRGKWYSCMGVRIWRQEALDYLYELRRDNPGIKFRCYRANEIESQSYIDYIDDKLYIYRGSAEPNRYSRYPVHIS